ncbi:SAM-dependent methyltransferase [Saccharopolyspora dendranthemae]|uniref:S-adenosyl-L-methionine-dependent methyltransferase n=1 Tax=Saccharopolyspora dendranthemae TaxID=1181886 RepID=A0A561V7L5_9PSEU|nr:SAM-dependent methyltransferase [Saccharopolyspora dendranthemae]TWG07602.1 methyltransferase (TIGR00027 family) [Saccharopolyspora dendranthemae]
MTGAPEGVGATALLTAYARAQEPERDSRLFTDPWAQLFVTTAVGDDEGILPRIGMARPTDPCELWETFRDYFVGRTPFYDKGILEQVQTGTRQIVILAAGMDSRAFRLDLPSDTVLYEVDTAPVLDFKNAALDGQHAEAICQRIPVAADLREPWIELLTNAGLDTDEPIVWVAEGLLMYLTPEQSHRLLGTITENSVPGSLVLTEYPARQVDEQTLLARTNDEADRGSARAIASIVQEGPGVEPAGWLHSFGWDSEVKTIGVQLAELGRPVPPLLEVTEDHVAIWLLSGSRS